MFRKIRISVFSVLLIAMVAGVLLTGGVAAQDDEFEGKIVITFWGSVDSYAANEGGNMPWQAAYNLILEWNEMHPGVKVEFVSDPGGADEKRTRLISDTAADLVASYADEAIVDGNLDLLYDFTDDLVQPNPYGQADTWREEFWLTTLRASGWSSGLIPEGEQYFLGNSSPSNIGQIIVFYNKDAFDAAGVTAVPGTLDELFQTCDALKGAGYEPFFVDGVSDLFIHWFGSWTGEELREPIVTQILEAWEIDRGFDVITEEMRFWAVQQDILRGDDPLTLESIKLMGDMRDHCFQEDWQAPEDEGFGQSYFINQRTTMMWNGFWALSGVGDDPERDFEFGTFAFPLTTTTSSELATATHPHRHGGLEGGEIGTSFMIPMTTVEKGNLPIVLDLLQFLTARETAEKWCEPQWPPCLQQGQDISDVVTDPVTMEHVYGFYNPPMSVETAFVGLSYFPGGDAYKRLAQLYLVGGISLEEVGKQLQAEYERELEKALVDNPDWDVENWPQLPE